MERTGPEGYLATDDQTRLDLDVVHGFLTTAYWSPGVSREAVERAVAGSLAVGLLAPGGVQAGFARVVTDRASFAWLADVFVLPGHRGRRLGRFLVQAVLEHPELQGLRRWMLATADAHGLYASFGFTPVADGSRFMVRERRAVERYGAGSSGATGATDNGAPGRT